jgi:hypothetical protein
MMVELYLRTSSKACLEPSRVFIRPLFDPMANYVLVFLRLYNLGLVVHDNIRQRWKAFR